MSNGVVKLLRQWPTRRAVFEDARRKHPTLKFVAVHRWFQRGRIPVAYHAALAEGAALRGLDLTIGDLVGAHSHPQQSDAV